MKRKRKLVTGLKPIGNPTLKSRKKARSVTAAYHVIKNELADIEKEDEGDGLPKNEKKAALEKELESIGGIDAYQRASIVSTQHFKTSRWVLSEISKHLKIEQVAKIQGKKKKKERGPIRVLEVGAINIQLQQVKHLDVRSIDINSQHPLIEEVDFFDVKPENNYDVVVCSMVLNCVHEVSRRGEMIARLRGHLRNPSSLLLLVLPIRCIRSKHLGDESFVSICAALGLTTVEIKETPKLLFYTFRRSGADDSSTDWRKACRMGLASLVKTDRALAMRFKEANYSGEQSVPTNEFCLSFEEDLLPAES